jgi:hypothetical protein
MNDLQKELQALKAKVVELESRILFPNEPVTKWQPKGGDWYVSVNGKTFCYTTRNEGCREFGTERQTEEQVKRAADEMRRFNRLLALRDELCGDAVVDWSNNKETYFVFYNNKSNMWKKDYILNLKFETPLFTSHESAQKACDMLNSGEVEL